MTDLFLSYARDDSLAMGVIRDNLRKLGFNVWVDIEHLEPGTPQWEHAVEGAARKTDVMLVLCSPAAKKSKWVNIEITIAELAGKTIIPVWVNGRDTLEAIPTSLLNAQYVDIRGRHPEVGFSELVAWLARHFALDIPDYQYETGAGHIPAIQVINVTGHVEGDVIAIGRDVEGDVNVAGGNIQQITARRTPPWAWIGGIGVAVIITIIGLITLSGNGGAGPPTTEEPTQTEIIVAEEETSEPTVPPTDKPTPVPLVPTIEPTAESTHSPALVLAEAGVGSNGEWEPYTQEFDGMVMALVPAGCFNMGSNNYDDDEQPVHKVCFDEPFWIGVYEVTNAQFAAFLNVIDYRAESGQTLLNAGGDEVCIHYSGTWQALGSYENHPVIEVSWYGAAAFCENRNMRLLTEAEWEYAARGPDGLVYPWGNDFAADKAYSGNSGVITSPVGSKPGGVSWVGAYDLSGNVWEWVNSLYMDYPYDPNDGREVNGNHDNYSNRVLRGGWWTNSTGGVRAADRAWYRPDGADGYFGFRCARSYQP